MAVAKQKGRKIKKRMLWFLLIVFLIIIALIVRIGYLQFVKGDEYRRLAIEQQTRDRIITPKRGAILDRNGKELAVSVSVETVSISPNIIKNNGNGEEIAEKLASVLEMEKEEILEKINKNSSYEFIKKKVDKEVCDKIREMELVGVNLDEDTKRTYPFGSLAAHVIGFVGTDNQGLNGIEMVFNKELEGKSGRIISAKNADGTDMPLKYERYYDSQDGTNVVLAIDEVIQHFAEKYLEEAAIENKVGNGAACIVMDPKTGEIVAMATYPSYDLNAPFTITSESAKARINSLEGEERQKELNAELQKIWRNKAVVDSYEPGSVFKIVTSAMAIEENLINYTETFNCSGSIHVAGRNISCWKHEGHGVETFVQGVQNSCNPVFIELGKRIGPDRFRKYFKAFGFTQVSGIEIPGEQSGIFHPENRFNEIELVTSAFGQTFQITPLQLISAVSAIANEGKLLKPHLVKQLTNQDGAIVKTYEPELVRQVVSKETANSLCQILESVVSEGTGANAYIKGFRVAGKTGTSEKQPRSENKVICSFCGFAPADDPKYVCLVLLDEPNGAIRFGGTIAAPVVGKVLDDTLRYVGVEPQYTSEEIENADKIVPDLNGTEVSEAKKQLSEQNLKYKIVGSGNTITDQTPKGFARLAENSTVILYTENIAPSEKVLVPAVTGKSAVEANTILTNAGLNIKLVGIRGDNQSALVSAVQSPAAGTEVLKGSVVTVEFRSTDVD